MGVCVLKFNKEKPNFKNTTKNQRTKDEREPKAVKGVFWAPQCLLYATSKEKVNRSIFGYLKTNQRK